jgi:hypothetical protein
MMNDKNNQFDKRFLILGDYTLINKYTKTKKQKKIVRKQQRGKLPGVWGTLGWKNDQAFNLEVINSKTGNTNENKRDIITTQIIEEIDSFNSSIKEISNDVVERFINFENTNFNIDWAKIKTYDDIPELRLDLFVKDEEGVIVFHYHQLKENFQQLNDESVYEQFIQCQKTDDNYTTKRDRLTYYFKVLPPYKYNITKNNQIEWTEELRTTSFILKIITFERISGTPGEILNDFFSKENIKLLASTSGASATYSLFGKNKNELLIYDNTVKSSSVASSNKNRFDMYGAFFKVDNEHKIDENKKTLLLIHGTFSNTLNTFESLIKLRNNSSELEDFLSINQYKQVIAFNHPTISADVFDNLKAFKKLLREVKFKKSVSLLAASRGCILAQAIGANKTIPFIVDKCLMFSPANGVGYFDVGEKIATGLGILKKVLSGRPSSYVLALLQFSAEYFLEQPGAQQMTFNSKELKKVTNAKLANKESKYTAVINEWQKILINKKGTRFWMQIADGIIKLMLGNEHDFVVGVKGQRNLPKQYNVTEIPMASTHCKYFSIGGLHIRNGNAVNLAIFMSKYL